MMQGREVDIQEDLLEKTFGWRPSCPDRFGHAKMRGKSAPGR